MTTELKQVDGQIASIDYDNRHFALEDRSGIIFLKVIWVQKFDLYMRKQKVGYYEKPTVIMTSQTAATLEDIRYVERPADWPKSGGKGKSYQPRNERLIVLQSCAKLGADVYAITNLTTVQPEDFESVMDLIIARAIKDTETLMKAAGGSSS
jgi:hypothetical protein